MLVIITNKTDSFISTELVDIAPKATVQQVVGPEELFEVSYALYAMELSGYISVTITDDPNMDDKYEPWGTAGPPGPAGPPGADGEQGIQGIQGEPGVPGAGLSGWISLTM